MKPTKKSVLHARQLRKNQTQAEKFFWEKVRNKRFHSYKFYRQYPVKYSFFMHQEKYFIADFYCHQNKLIIEIDGEYHRFRKEYDNQRTAILTDKGFTVIRFSNQQVLESWSQVEKVLLKRLV